MSFGMLLFWTIVVAGIVWLVRNTGSHSHPSSEQGVPVTKPIGAPRPNARDILDARYACGEISDEQYRSRRDTLASR
jgi:putative membrane protein